MQCECLGNSELKACLSLEEVKEEGIFHCREKTVYFGIGSANSITKLFV